mmetsp:Transcript_8008/g.33463  ORF Transcript_8008/g.33463 Transcript_8008/m.33463 type:complete len:1353 (+) Transcript_8008:155-4213(+)
MSSRQGSVCVNRFGPRDENVDARRGSHEFPRRLGGGGGVFVSILHRGHRVGQRGEHARAPRGVDGELVVRRRGGVDEVRDEAHARDARVLGRLARVPEHARRDAGDAGEERVRGGHRRARRDGDVEHGIARPGSLRRGAGRVHASAPDAPVGAEQLPAPLLRLEVFILLHHHAHQAVRLLVLAGVAQRGGVRLRRLHRLRRRLLGGERGPGDHHRLLDDGGDGAERVHHLNAEHDLVTVRLEAAGKDPLPVGLRRKVLLVVRLRGVIPDDARRELVLQRRVVVLPGSRLDAERRVQRDARRGDDNHRPVAGGRVLGERRESGGGAVSVRHVQPEDVRVPRVERVGRQRQVLRGERGGGDERLAGTRDGPEQVHRRGGPVVVVHARRRPKQRARLGRRLGGHRRRQARDVAGVDFVSGQRRDGNAGRRARGARGGAHHRHAAFAGGAPRALGRDERDGVRLPRARRAAQLQRFDPSLVGQVDDVVVGVEAVAGDRRERLAGPGKLPVVIRLLVRVDGGGRVQGQRNALGQKHVPAHDHRLERRRLHHKVKLGVRRDGGVTLHAPFEAERVRHAGRQALLGDEQIRRVRVRRRGVEHNLRAVRARRGVPERVPERRRARRVHRIDGAHHARVSSAGHGAVHDGGRRDGDGHSAQRAGDAVALVPDGTLPAGESRARRGDVAARHAGKTRRVRAPVDVRAQREPVARRSAVALGTLAARRVAVLVRGALRQGIAPAVLDEARVFLARLAVSELPRGAFPARPAHRRRLVVLAVHALGARIIDARVVIQTPGAVAVVPVGTRAAHGVPVRVVRAGDQLVAPSVAHFARARLDAARLAGPLVPRGARAARPPPRRVRAIGQPVAVAVALLALVDVRARHAVAVVAGGTRAAQPPADDVRARHQRRAPAVHEVHVRALVAIAAPRAFRVAVALETGGTRPAGHARRGAGVGGARHAVHAPAVGDDARVVLGGDELVGRPRGEDVDHHLVHALGLLPVRTARGGGPERALREEIAQDRASRRQRVAGSEHPPDGGGGVRHVVLGDFESNHQRHGERAHLRQAPAASARASARARGEKQAPRRDRGDLRRGRRVASLGRVQDLRRHILSRFPAIAGPALLIHQLAQLRLELADLGRRQRGLRGVAYSHELVQERKSGLRRVGGTLVAVRRRARFARLLDARRRLEHAGVTLRRPVGFEPIVAVGLARRAGGERVGAIADGAVFGRRGGVAVRGFVLRDARRGDQNAQIGARRHARNHVPFVAPRRTRRPRLHGSRTLGVTRAHVAVLGRFGRVAQDHGRRHEALRHRELAEIRTHRHADRFVSLVALGLAHLAGQKRVFAFAAFGSSSRAAVFGQRHNAP